MNDDRTTLASAYLDGEVTADERARVEGDTALMDEVGRLRQVRALLGDVEPAAISQREEHLATALGAWDRLPDTERGSAARDATPRSMRATGTVTTLGSSSRRRAGMNRRLLGAAAAITLVLAGGIVLQSVSGDDDLEQSDATSDTTGEAASSLDAASSAESGDAESAEAETAIAQSDVAGGDATDDDATEESATGENPTGDTLATGIDDAAPPGERTLDLLQTPEDLATFAAASVGAPVSPDVPAATSAPIGDEDTALLEAELPLCLGADYVAGPAFYRGVEVVVGVDEGRELALAYLAEDCSEVARARLP